VTPEQTVVGLKAEAARKLAEAEHLEKMLITYPDLRRYEGRWKKIVFCSASVNSRVTNYDQRFNCGCCEDSPLEIWPYLETATDRVYSDPPNFTVGERDDSRTYRGVRAYDGWKDKFIKAGISEGVTAQVEAYLTSKEAETDEDSSDDD
jgi:hypothetical protein